MENYFSYENKIVKLLEIMFEHFSTFFQKLLYDKLCYSNVIFYMAFKISRPKSITVRTHPNLRTKNARYFH